MTFCRPNHWEVHSWNDFSSNGRPERGGAPSVILSFILELSPVGSNKAGTSSPATNPRALSIKS